MPVSPSEPNGNEAGPSQDVRVAQGKGEHVEPSSKAGGESGTSTSGSGGAGDGGSNFECNICLELAHDPVVTLCGHLFCWPCLYRWLQIHSHSRECPVCKAGVEEEKVVPLYGRGNTNAVDPRKKPVAGPDIPHRPQGQRSEPLRHHHPNQNFNFVAGAGPFASAQFGNFTLSAGFGLFPSLFGAWQYQAFGPADGSTPPGNVAGGARTGQALTQEQMQQAFLSRLLLFLGSFVILCLLFF